jgi:hypothetical protein
MRMLVVHEKDIQASSKKIPSEGQRFRYNITRGL